VRALAEDPAITGGGLGNRGPPVAAARLHAGHRRPPLALMRSRRSRCSPSYTQAAACRAAIRGRALVIAPATEQDERAGSAWGLEMQAKAKPASRPRRRRRSPTSFSSLKALSRCLPPRSNVPDEAEMSLFSSSVILEILYFALSFQRH
jgi:hypothetical protein